MKYEKPLLEGLLLQRYKRFFADVEYKGETYTIHVPNTGSMKGVIEKESLSPQKCRFSLHGDESKKLKGTLEAIQTSDGVWVGVNTSNPNRIVKEAIEESIQNKVSFLPWWKEYSFYKPEYKINKETRLDGAFILEPTQAETSKKHFIEIKNTTYFEKIDDKSVALFPDTKTERGQKHLSEMMALIDQGHKCEIIYTVQRSDAEYFAPAYTIDKKYGELFDQAVNKGLIVTPLQVYADTNEIYLTNKVLKLYKQD